MQEISEHLDGMVYGWKNPRCRIFVRFADSAEQRDMRVSHSIRYGDAMSVYSDGLLPLSFSSLPPSPVVDGVGTCPDLRVVLFNRCK